MENENTRMDFEKYDYGFFSGGWEVRSWKHENAMMEFSVIQWRMKNTIEMSIGIEGYVEKYEE